jgi:hypothetical protein
MDGISVLVAELMDDFLDLLMVFVGQGFTDDIFETASSSVKERFQLAPPATPW